MQTMTKGRIAAAFERARDQKRIAFMPYLMLGYPTLDAAVDLAEAIVRGGADLIELGVPFSDPLADGATVQHASQIALDNHMTLSHSFELARHIRARVGDDVALLFMGYYNPIYSYGIERYVRDAKAVGVDGLIVPDLPVEEAEELVAPCREVGLDYIGFAAPTSTDARLQQLARVASGFVYCVALVGVTGVRAQMVAALPDFIKRVRVATDLPLAVGFGISTPEHVANVAKIADGAIVGSALIDVIERAPASEQAAVAEAFVRHLQTGNHI